MSSEITKSTNQSTRATRPLESQEQFEPDASCDNCGTSLNGPYCHACGQSSRSMIKFFGLLFREILDDVIGYDSRLKHTIFPLLFKPGQITNDYIKGRRFFYVLPLRLYLISSLLFILLLKVTTDPTKLLESQQKAENAPATQVQPTPTDKEEADRLSVEAPQVKLPSLEFSQSTNEADTSQNNLQDSKQDEKPQVQSEENSEDQDFGINISDEGIQFQGEEFKQEGFIKEFAQEIEKKWQGWKADPKPLVKQVIELLPYMMFVLLPIFALFLKIFYLFSKRFYIEHLIFLLHNHCFIYVALMLKMGLDYLDGVLSVSNNWLASSVGNLAGLLSVLFGWWMILYVFLSLRKVFQQSWMMTISKGVLLGVIYFALISIGFIVTLLAGAYFV